MIEVVVYDACGADQLLTPGHLFVAGVERTARGKRQEMLFRLAVLGLPTAFLLPHVDNVGAVGAIPNGRQHLPKGADALRLHRLSAAKHTDGLIENAFGWFWCSGCAIMRGTFLLRLAATNGQLQWPWPHAGALLRLAPTHFPPRPARAIRPAPGDHS